MKGPKNETGGWGGIRTLETLARLPVFKTGAFNHSATHPLDKSIALDFRSQRVGTGLAPEPRAARNVTSNTFAACSCWPGSR